MTLPEQELPRVCIFTETYFPVVGGGETQARLLAEGLVARGSTVTILTRRSNAALMRVESFGSVSIHRLGPVGHGQLKKWGLLISSLPALVKLSSHYDLIFVSGYRIIGPVAVMVARLFGKVVVLKADSQGEMSGAFFAAGLRKVRMRPEQLPFSFFLRLRNAVLRRADAFVAITPEGLAELSVCNVDNRRIYTIPNAVDTERFRPAGVDTKHAMRRELRIPPESVVVVYTGRLVSYKGLPLLLQVWQEIHRRHKNATLLLVGSGGLDMHNCEDELRHFVSINDLQDTVRFTGSVPDVEAYLQAADIFAFPSENDAFPSAVIEAMSCGLAVVSTPVGALGSILQDGQNGLLVPPANPEQLLRALERLIGDSGLVARLGAAGRRTVLSRYAANVVVQRYIDLFLATTATRKPAAVSIND